METGEEKVACGAKVSIIVPIYNVAKYLKKCIDSIIAQTYGKMEIILVDDGSTDGSAQICDKYQEKDTRIIVIHKQNEGLVRARKTGLSHAVGKYVCYVDGDDWIKADLIGHLAADMAEANADLIVSDYLCVTGDTVQKVKHKLEAGIYDTKSIIPMMLYNGKFYEFGVSQFVWAKLFRRDLLADVQMRVDDRICCGEDTAVTYPYILRTNKICISDYAGYYYVQRPDSMTNGFNTDELVRSQILVRYLQKEFEQSRYVESLSRQLNQYAKNLLLARYAAYFDSIGHRGILASFGGISQNARVVLYGAGKFGQSIYFYLKSLHTVKLIDWIDKNYNRYQEMNLKVHHSEQLRLLEEETYDYVIITIINQSVAMEICSEIVNMGIKKEKIKYLSADFISEDNFILDTF